MKNLFLFILLFGVTFFHLAAQAEVSGPDDLTQSARTDFSNALKLIQSEQYDQAAPGLQAVLKEFPDFAEAHMTYALVLDKQGNTAGAITEYEKAVRLKPGLLPAWLALASAHQKAGNLPSSVMAFNKYLQLNPQAPNAEKIRKHIESLNKQIIVNQINKLSTEAHDLAKQKRYDEAITKLKQCVELKPDWAGAWLQLGVVQTLAGEYQAAIVSMETFLKLDPQSEKADTVRDRIAAVRKAINELNVHGLAEEAIDLMRSYKYKEASEKWESVLQGSPDSTSHRYNYGVCLSKSGKYPEAMAQFQKCVDLKPDWDKPWLLLGTLQQKDGDYQAAAESYEKFLELAPEDEHAEDVRKNIAILKKLPGQCKAAALLKEARNLLKDKQYEQSAAKYKEATSLLPEFAEGFGQYGLALGFSGNKSDAIVQLKKSLEMKRDQPHIWHYLGSVYQQTGNLDGAIEAYQTYLELAPDEAEEHKTSSMILSLTDLADRFAQVNTSPDDDDYFKSALLTGAARWPKKNMPLRVFLKDSSSTAYFRPELDEILKDSFKAWSDTAGRRIKFRFVKNPLIADITCKWTNDPKELHSAIEGGHAQVSKGGHKIRKVSIFLKTTELNSDRPTSDKEAKTVCLHEIGHALGLDHSDNPRDCMFYTTSDEQSSITDRDKNTIIALYTADESTFEDPPEAAKRYRLQAADESSEGHKLLTLVNEAYDALRNDDYSLAKEKLDEAAALDAENETVNTGLGVYYASQARNAALVRNLVKAEMLYEKAIAYFEKAMNKADLINTLKNYSVVLRANRNEKAASKAKRRAKKLRKAKR